MFGTLLQSTTNCKSSKEGQRGQEPGAGHCPSPGCNPSHAPGGGWFQVRCFAPEVPGALQSSALPPGCVPISRHQPLVCAGHPSHLPRHYPPAHQVLAGNLTCTVLGWSAGTCRCPQCRDSLGCTSRWLTARWRTWREQQRRHRTRLLLLQGPL